MSERIKIGIFHRSSDKRFEWSAVIEEPFFIFIRVLESKLLIQRISFQNEIEVVAVIEVSPLDLRDFDTHSMQTLTEGHIDWREAQLRPGHIGCPKDDDGLLKLLEIPDQCLPKVTVPKRNEVTAIFFPSETLQDILNLALVLELDLAETVKKAVEVADEIHQEESNGFQIVAIRDPSSSKISRRDTRHRFFDLEES